MATAVLQAGGKSERMRRTAGPGHKALRNVLGLPLLERNLCRFLVAGFDSLVVVISETEGTLQDYISNRACKLAASRGAKLHMLVESNPLGTIGAAAMLSAKDAPILVVYSDNLTSLDFRKLVAAHESRNPAMTLATHKEPFQIPFGEVIAHDDKVVDYREKSIHPICVSSGIYVLGPKALACLQEGERVDSPDLVHRLLGQNELVLNYPHDELWLDMNDATRHAELEQLIFKHPQRLEWLQPKPDREGYLLVEWIDRLKMPVVNFDVKPTSPSAKQLIGSFDEIDVEDGKIVRWTVSLASETRGTIESLRQSDTHDKFEAASKESRAIAYATAHLASTQNGQSAVGK